jgi:hypothetical protein
MISYFNKLFLILILLIFVSNHGNSQPSLSYYSSSHPKIGLGYEFSTRFWSEIRLYNNNEFSDITSELVLCNNVAHKERYNIYIGVGVTANFNNGGVVLPVGLQFFPIKDFNKFSLHIEFLTGTYAGDDPYVRSSLGIRYQFGKDD